ncbi:formyltetrahydrofolate deformylase [Klebsiella pneumoniae]|uniref:Formyltetrahydrofolate deformylase n=1 Tax=Klebsiella pneumoniae TaxID=573 RepID=A0A3S4I1N5_KLEPN|nr:formyltetrahydrofolate deformylase [Klebsiella pneumoniae]
MHSLQRKVLRTICPDQKGLIARITNICYKHELNIVQNNEFVDHRTGRFFMRTELEGIFNDATLLADLDSALPEGSIRELNPAGRRRVVILVTKEAALSGRSANESQLRRGWMSILPRLSATMTPCARWWSALVFRLSWSAMKD